MEIVTMLAAAAGMRGAAENMTHAFRQRDPTYVFSPFYMRAQRGAEAVVNLTKRVINDRKRCETSSLREALQKLGDSGVPCVIKQQRRVAPCNDEEAMLELLKFATFLGEASRMDGVVAPTPFAIAEPFAFEIQDFADEKGPIDAVASKAASAMMSLTRKAAAIVESVAERCRADASDAGAWGFVVENARRAGFVQRIAPQAMLRPWQPESDALSGRHFHEFVSIVGSAVLKVNAAGQTVAADTSDRNAPFAWMERASVKNLDISVYADPTSETCDEPLTADSIARSLHRRVRRVSMTHGAALDGPKSKCYSESVNSNTWIGRERKQLTWQPSDGCLARAGSAVTVQMIILKEFSPLTPNVSALPHPFCDPSPDLRIFIVAHPMSRFPEDWVNAINADPGFRRPKAALFTPLQLVAQHLRDSLVDSAVHIDTIPLPVDTDVFSPLSDLVAFGGPSLRLPDQLDSLKWRHEEMMPTESGIDNTKVVAMGEWDSYTDMLHPFLSMYIATLAMKPVGFRQSLYVSTRRVDPSRAPAYAQTREQKRAWLRDAAMVRYDMDTIAAKASFFAPQFIRHIVAITEEFGEDELVKFLGTMDMGVKLSMSESTGIAIRRFMAMGLPMIVANSPSLHELIDPNGARDIVVDVMEIPPHVAEQYRYSKKLSSPGVLWMPAVGECLFQMDLLLHGDQRVDKSKLSSAARKIALNQFSLDVVGAIIAERVEAVWRNFTA
jgi:glycosyltransferase involved in cell wall biosynthesis